MRLSSIFVALFFAPLTLSAQSMPTPSASQIEHLHQDLERQRQMLVTNIRNASSCPVGFSVDRKPDGAIVWTNSPNPRASHGQGVDITFARPKAQIASADIVVHGYPAGLRIVPAAPSAPSEITESFHLTATADLPLLHPSVWTAHMVAISWVELTRLDYTDGATWQSAAPRQCSAAPSLFVPVDSAR
jgi:hypothetical protein